MGREGTTIRAAVVLNEYSILINLHVICFIAKQRVKHVYLICLLVVVKTGSNFLILKPRSNRLLLLFKTQDTHFYSICNLCTMLSEELCNFAVFYHI